MTGFGRKPVVVGLALVVAAALSYMIANASPGEPVSQGCEEWIFQPTQAGGIKASAADGYLFCPTTGEMWQIDADKKVLVKEK